MIDHFFSFYPNRGQLAPVDFYTEWFDFCFDNIPHAAAFTIWAAPQIAIYRPGNQPAKYPPKKTNDKKRYETDGE